MLANILRATTASLRHYATPLRRCCAPCRYAAGLRHAAADTDVAVYFRALLLTMRYAACLRHDFAMMRYYAPHLCWRLMLSILCRHAAVSPLIFFSVHAAIISPPLRHVFCYAEIR